MDAEADAWARHMADSDILAYRPSLYPYTGEVILSGAEDPQQALQIWFDSPSHREIILSGRYDKLGVGYADGYWIAVLN